MSGPGPGGRRAGRGGRRRRGRPTGRPRLGLAPGERRGHGPGEAGLDPGVPAAAGQGFSLSCCGSLSRSPQLGPSSPTCRGG